jgi:hypothetical protein
VKNDTVARIEDYRPRISIEMAGESVDISEATVIGIVRGSIPLDSPEAQVILRTLIADWYSDLLYE